MKETTTRNKRKSILARMVAIATSVAIIGAFIGTAVAIWHHGRLTEAPKRWDISLDKQRHEFAARPDSVVWPVTGQAMIIRNFGHNQMEAEHLHNVDDNNIGVDIVCDNTAPQAAIAVLEGTIEDIETRDDGTLAVAVRADDGRLTIYGNIHSPAPDNMKLNRDRRIAIGDTLGFVAVNNDGEMVLHFELWQHGIPVEPNILLPDMGVSP